MSDGYKFKNQAGYCVKDKSNREAPFRCVGEGCPFFQECKIDDRHNKD